MSFLTFSMVVLAALIHATWNLLAKRAAHAGPAFVAATNVVSCMVYLPWVAWLLARNTLPWSGPVVACIVASGLLHLAYSLCLQKGYRVADLSVVYPVARGTGPLLSSIGAFVLLGETPTGRGLLGLAAIVLGIGLIATQGRLAMFRQARALQGVRWGGATGALIAGYTVVDAYGVKTLGIQAVILDWCSNMVRLCVLLPWMLRNRANAVAAMRGHWGLALAVGALSPLSYILVLEALELGAPLSVVAPTREMSMMVGALLGMVVLKERVGPGRALGCALLALGVVLLGTPA
ncbi:EamA family transporter [Pseudorhodoferax sp. Leaf267]|uniref:EamA family transporter n=1 Tax=Pseudorhodoferax sp. Leaf267 TaxID=1736316 RepID=UPI0006F2B88A|nr:EamA family transporter [Pseudorhodoferax sp. Leaf267]KQP19580.1 multidrug DMT transporter permease [Pseudorhodoferax sp. Leaf267]